MEPYRVLFPLGLLCGLWGTFIWILFGTRMTLNYPGSIHPDLMMGGFLFSFAAGFLMTAVPRFTGSFGARSWEIFVVVGLILLMLMAEGQALWYPEWRVAGLLLSCLGIVVLIIYAARRFLRRTHTPPPSFAFVGVGLLCGVAGTSLLALWELQWVSETLRLLGRSLYYHGMMLSLVLGVGARLMPALMGWAANPMVELSLPRAPAKARRPSLVQPIGLALLFLLSFPIELLFREDVGRSLRALTATLVGFQAWRLHKRPPAEGFLPFWLRISGWSLILGLWIYALVPGFSVHGVHIAFAGEFSLLTLMIATRVTLSHGGHNLRLERTSQALKWTAYLLMFAAVVRVLAPYAGQRYVSHLAYASWVWILAIAIWARGFLPKMLHKQDSSERTTSPP